MGRKAHHLLSPRGILLRGERHDLLARGAGREAAITAIACECASEAMMAVKAPSSSRALESAKDRFYRFWVETQGDPPPHHLMKPPSPPSLPQHRRQFTRLRCFQAAQQKATKAPSRSVSRQDSLGGSRHEAPSIPIGACPNGVSEGTSTPFMCGNVANIPRRGSHLPSLRGL